ncbi:MAG TPA: ACP S-malonyltransferase [Deltaproteobacteria bacterium]|nr:ACP S-malonyltransferase [Deltaproteobacteria bacterium]
MAEGPADELDRTVNAQPAVLGVSVALWERSGFHAPAAVLGHSLGEYTALVASGCLSPGEAVGLVKKRAEFMDASRPRGKGGMAAVIGLGLREVEETIAQVPDLWIANLNGPSQVVVSGNRESIDEATPLLRDRGARRVVPLKVSVASHCPYMAQAREDLGAYLATVELKEPCCPIVPNASARPETDPGRIRGLLADQLVQPVRFEESVRAALAMGIDEFVEIGPRSVLAPLVKRIVPEARMEVITNDGH